MIKNVKLLFCFINILFLVACDDSIDLKRTTPQEVFDLARNYADGNVKLAKLKNQFEKLSTKDKKELATIVKDNNNYLSYLLQKDINDDVVAVVNKLLDSTDKSSRSMLINNEKESIDCLKMLINKESNSKNKSKYKAIYTFIKHKKELAKDLIKNYPLMNEVVDFQQKELFEKIYLANIDPQNKNLAIEEMYEHINDKEKLNILNTYNNFFNICRIKNIPVGAFLCMNEFRATLWKHTKEGRKNILLELTRRKEKGVIDQDHLKQIEKAINILQQETAFTKKIDDDDFIYEYKSTFTFPLLK